MAIILLCFLVSTSVIDRVVVGQVWTPLLVSCLSAEHVTQGILTVFVRWPQLLWLVSRVWLAVMARITNEPILWFIGHTCLWPFVLSDGRWTNPMIACFLSHTHLISGGVAVSTAWHHPFYLRGRWCYPRTRTCMCVCMCAKLLYVCFLSVAECVCVNHRLFCANVLSMQPYPWRTLVGYASDELPAFSVCVWSFRCVVNV